MPKTSPHRAIHNERNIAERVRLERESRGWTYDGLAKRMGDAGYPVSASGLYKLEHGKPPRRITADELIGFAEVFGLDLTTMVEPVGALYSRRAMELIGLAQDALGSLAKSVDQLVEYQVELARIEASTASDDAKVRERLGSLPFLPSLMITRPMTKDLDLWDSAPDPIGDAWTALAEGIRDYARWLVAEDAHSEGRRATRRKAAR